LFGGKYDSYDSKEIFEAGDCAGPVFHGDRLTGFIMKIFLTGGTGNIGQYVTRALLEAGHELILYSRTPERIPQIGLLKNVTMVKGNLLDLEIMGRALQGCEALIHIALGYGLSPLEMLEHDTRVSAYLMETAESAGVKNFVYTSSTAAMGILKDGMDEMSYCEPDTLYGATKAATEKFLLGFRQYYNAQAVRGRKVTMRRNIIRPGYTFSNPAFEGGASQSDKRFRDIARAAIKGEDMVFARNDGTQFISASQIAQVYVKLVESDLDQEIFLTLGETFTSWADIARWAVGFSPGSASKVLYQEDDALKQPARYNTGKLKRVFGLAFDAADELKDHVRWNVERERKVLSGETVHDVYHVW
jgi:UDP-glucose 4-epimerase